MRNVRTPLILSAFIVLSTINYSYSQTTYNTTKIEHPFNYNIQGVVLQGNTLFFSRDNVFGAFDVSDPKNPALLDTLTLFSWKPGQQYDEMPYMTLYDQYLIGSTGMHGTFIIDISDPSHLQVTGMLDIPYNGCLYIWRNYLITRHDSLKIYDISSLATPVKTFEMKAHFTTGSGIFSAPSFVNISDDTIYVATHSYVDSLMIAVNIIQCGTLQNDGTILFNNDPVVIDAEWPYDISFLFFHKTNSRLLTSVFDTDHGVGVYEATNLHKISQLSMLPTPYAPDIAYVDGDYVYIMVSLSPPAFLMYDTAIPDQPILKASYLSPISGLYAGMQVIDNYVYIYGGNQGLEIIRIDGETPVPAVSNITAISLHPAYPNPFTGSTHISYTLAAQEYVSLEVFDMLGRKVHSLYEGVQQPGVHTAEFSASGIPAGAYRAVLRTANGTQSKTVVVQ